MRRSLFACFLLLALVVTARAEMNSRIEKIEWQPSCNWMDVYLRCERDESFLLIADSCEPRPGGTNKIVYRGHCDAVRNGIFHVPGLKAPAGTIIFLKTVREGCNPDGFTVPPCR